MKKTEPMYIHIILTVVILVLVYVLAEVAYFIPKEKLDNENYWTQESHLRMNNIRQAEILWKNKFKKFTDNLDSLILFIKTDSTVLAKINGYDSLSMKPTNPFDTLTNGRLDFDSLFYSPKSHKFFILKVDTTVKTDSTFDHRGRFRGIDTTIIIGSKYYLASPDGYGTIGDLERDALINTASWE